MEEIKNASISVNLSEGNISISGSEQFVEKNMKEVFAFVKDAALSKTVANTKTTLNTPSISEAKENDIAASPEYINDTGEKDKYRKLGIYSVDPSDGTIAIHRKVPGNTNADKMKSIALIVLYEKNEPIAGTTLKALCEKQGCWDRNNSAAIFEREFKLFIKKKISKQKWTISLTIDGEKAAKDLLEEIAHDKK